MTSRLDVIRERLAAYAAAEKQYMETRLREHLDDWDRVEFVLKEEAPDDLRALLAVVDLLAKYLAAERSIPQPFSSVPTPELMQAIELERQWKAAVHALTADGSAGAQSAADAEGG